MVPGEMERPKMTRQRERKTCSRCGRRIVVKLTDGYLCNHKDPRTNRWCGDTATDDDAAPVRRESSEERMVRVLWRQQGGGVPTDEQVSRTLAIQKGRGRFFPLVLAVTEAMRHRGGSQ